MSNDKVQKESDYSKFRSHMFNRKVREKPGLQSSMAKHGFIKACAIMVRPLPKSERPCVYEIIKGHHRFEYARRLGLPVYFIVDDSSATLGELENNGQNWSVADHAFAQATAGNQDIIRMLEFQKQHNLPFGVAASLFGGEGAGSNNKVDQIKRGTYKAGDLEHANAVVKITDACSLAGIKFATSKAFAAAVSSALRVPEFDGDRFCKCVEGNPGGIRRCTNQYDYLSEFESLYNYGAKARRFALKFRAIEEMRKRQETFGGNRHLGEFKKKPA